jgi:hypothetical protein
MLLANDPSLVELRWNLSVLESPSSGPQHRTSFSKLEKRTYIHYSDADYIAPEILPCNNAFANLLAAALSNNTTLTSLTIGGHLGSDIQKRNYVENISDEGAMILAGALVSNKCLTFLDLSVNRIEDRGAELLARALYSNRTLKKLNLCRNFIAPNGLFELAQSLVRNFILDELLVGNQLRATHQGNSVVCSDYQRNLVNLIEHTLKRKRELLGRELLHGYMEKTAATKRLQLVKREGRLLPGSFLLYLRRSIPNVIFLACAVDVKKIKTEQARGSKVPPFLLNRIEEHEKRKKHKQLQASSVSTSATSSSTHFHHHFTNGNGTSFSTTPSSSSSSSSSSTKDKVMIVHKAIYKGNYKYSFSRMGCLSPGSKPEVPSLFDHCSWVICSDEQLYQTAMSIFPEEISDRIGKWRKNTLSLSSHFSASLQVLTSFAQLFFLFLFFHKYFLSFTLSCHQTFATSLGNSKCS